MCPVIHETERWTDRGPFPKCLFNQSDREAPAWRIDSTQGGRPTGNPGSPLGWVHKRRPPGRPPAAMIKEKETKGEQSERKRLLGSCEAILKLPSDGNNYSTSDSLSSDDFYNFSSNFLDLAYFNFGKRETLLDKSSILTYNALNIVWVHWAWIPSPI